MGKKTRVFIIKILICIFVVLFFLFLNMHISGKRTVSFFMTEDNSAYAYQVDDISDDDEYLIVKGWFIELKKVKNQIREVADNKTLGVILYDLNSMPEYDMDGNEKTKSGIKLSVEQIERKNVNEYFSCEFDYSKCGFIAKVEKKLLDLENGQYQIVFKTDELSSNGIGSNSYLCKGKLQYIAPEDEFEFGAMPIEMRMIIDNGICLAGSQTEKIWVFQYENRLYWIISNLLFVNDDQIPYIRYQIDTTQFDKLPNDRISSENYWDDKGGEMESLDINDQSNNGEYRIYFRDIPSEYSVASIKTGIKIDNIWVWERMIRPYYIFD